MKILNLYAGIGGNRLKWDDHDITAVELNPDISQIYEERFPQDTVIVEDVMEFIRVEEINDYDFIWASSPCFTHTCAVFPHQRYVPDLRQLFGLRIFLDNRLRNTKYTIENVQAWYQLPIEWKPRAKIDRHLFWSNFHINNRCGKSPGLVAKSHVDKRERSFVYRATIEQLAEYHQVPLELLEGYPGPKDKILRNMTHYSIGEYVLLDLQNITNLTSYLELPTTINQD